MAILRDSPYSSALFGLVIPLVPHEAVPEVSKGKVHINQKKNVLIGIDCDFMNTFHSISTSHSISHATLFDDDSNNVVQSTTLYHSVLQSSTKYYKLLFRTTPHCKVLQGTSLYYKILLRYYSVLQSTTPYYKVLLRTSKYYKVLLQYYTVLLLFFYARIRWHYSFTLLIFDSTILWLY